MTGIAAAYDHCAALLRSDDPDAWLAALLAPAAVRPHLHALGAFALEASLVRSRVKQAIAGEIRLQWWQDVVDGDRMAEANANPVAAALIDTIERAALPRELFGGLLDARRGELYDDPSTDLDALERRLAAIHATPIRLAARALSGGAAARSADAAAEDAGIAIGLADLLEALRGPQRPPLPSRLLERHCAPGSDVAAGRATPEVKAALAELRAAARGRLAALRTGRPRIGEAGPAFLRAALVEPRLRLGEAAVDPFLPVPDLPQWRRQWRLWRAARRGGAL